MQEFCVIDQNHLMMGDRERDKGALTRAFTIKNSGSKTIFSEDGTNPKSDASIGRFDQFQESLLHNYSLYRETVCKSRTLAARR
jgi:hypothetical protein